MLKNFFQWLWAVICFIPAAIFVLILFTVFFVFCKFTDEPSEGTDARDNHSYFDPYE